MKNDCWSWRPRPRFGIICPIRCKKKERKHIFFYEEKKKWFFLNCRSLGCVWMVEKGKNEQELQAKNQSYAQEEREEETNSDFRLKKTFSTRPLKLRNWKFWNLDQFDLLEQPLYIRKRVKQSFPSKKHLIHRDGVNIYNFTVYYIYIHLITQKRWSGQIWSNMMEALWLKFAIGSAKIWATEPFMFFF